MKKLVNSAIDATVNALEQVSTPTIRAGWAVGRVGKMLEKGVDPQVIAMQMTKNSPKGTRYTASKVQAYGELYQDAKTKAPITAEQSKALIKDQISCQFDNGNLQST
jgi:hypothetical protein